MDLKAYASPSGEYIWKVNPSEMFGRGEAAYELVRNGVPVWKGSHPFTLFDAGVSDDGLLAGYGYTQGVEGEGRDDGHFQIAIIDAKGDLRLNELVRREPSRFLHTDADPMATGVLVDGVNDRFVVRVRDPDINRRQESWWRYQLSSGKPVGKVILQSDDPSVRAPLGAHLIPATPLVLLSYWRYQTPDVGARFELVDEDMKEIWAMNLTRDYEGIDDQLRWKIWSDGVVSNIRSNQFTIAAIATAERITYRVDPHSQKPGEWIVKEVAREKASATAPVVAAGRPDVPVQPLKLLGTFSFGGDAVASVVRDVMHFDIDAQGRIGFIRRESEKKYSFVCVEPDGKLVLEKPLDIPQTLVTNTTPKVAALQDNRWVIVAARYGIEPMAAAWLMDAGSGKLNAIPGFVCPSVNSIVGSRDGGFVILANERFKYSSEDQLIAYDKNGKQEWMIKQDYSKNESALFSPEDIAVSTSGKIACLDNIRRTVQFFSPQGKFLHVLKLEELWGRKPNYPSDISADEKDGVLIRDFHGTPPIVRMDSAGKIVSEFDLKQRDGRVLDPIRGIRVDPSGRIWICDGESFVRVNRQGVEEFATGSATELEKLGKVAAVTIDPKGRLYAVDDRTAAVHVYNETGERLLVCKPDASDFSGKLSLPQVTVRSDGNVYLERDNHYPAKPDYLHFAADGKRIGIERFALDDVTEKWHAFPQTNQFLVMGYHDAFITDQQGGVLRTIRRRPDDKWLGNPSGASIAPDGSFAIFTGYDYGAAKNREAHLYNRDGEPIRSVSLPSGCRISGAVYTGRFIATRNETDICLLDTHGKPVLKFSPEIKNFKDANDETWKFFVANERELWLVASAQKTVWRFQLP